MPVARSDQEYIDNVWGGFRIQAAPGESDVESLRLMNDRARSAWVDIHKTHQRKMGDTTKTPMGQLVESAKFARHALEARRNEFAASSARANERLASLQDKINRVTNPPSDPGEAVLFAELRQMLRALPLGERLEVLKAASVGDGDARLLHAAISGPAVLGLLPPDLHEHYQTNYLAVKAPQEYGEKVRIEGALEAATYGMQQLEEHASALIDFPTAAAVERSAS